MALERRTGYKPDHKSFGRFLLSEQARDPAVEAAHNIVTLVQSRVAKRTGHQAESYKVNENPPPVTLQGNPRAIAEVYSDDPAALADEFGNAKRRNPGRPLGKSGAEIGEMRGQPG
jgi:hypothetical protein